MRSHHINFREPVNPRFRHFFDQNALTLWLSGVALIIVLAALPAFV